MKFVAKKQTKIGFDFAQPDKRIILKFEKNCAIRGGTTKNFTKFALQIKKDKYENKSKIRN